MRLAPLPCSILVGLLLSGSANAQAPAEQPPNPEDLLGNLVIEAGATRSLPKIAVLPSLASDVEDVTLSAVVRRDLDLCGEFELLPSSAAPEGLFLADSPIDVKAWSGKGVEALVKVNGKHLGNGKAELRAEAILLGRGAVPAFEKRVTIDPADIRVESHRLADLIIGALTGQNGSFASHMTFSSGTGRNRSVYTIDADGNNAKLVTPADRVAIASAFGPNEDLFYTASRNHGEFAVYSTGRTEPWPQPIKGSVYSLAFSKDRAQVALSIGVGSTIQVFLGPDTATAKLASPVKMAIEPAFSPSGKLAFAGEGRWGQRIYVDNKPISPDGVFASAPTFCNNPNGVRVVFTAGSDKFADLVSTSERGGGLSRLTQNQGRNSAPACSPDGRLVAFFSTRTSGEGPGLYIMRLDGGRPKRISSLLGDTLRWDPLPPRQEPAVQR
jgi:TolB protein